MSDAVFFAVVGLLVAGAIALALVWPQGLGTPAPAPFGHPMTAQSDPSLTPNPAPPFSQPAVSPPPQLKGAL